MNASPVHSGREAGKVLKMGRAKKAGVMIYFDTIQAVDAMSREQAGDLFRAILHYAASGQDDQPEGLDFAWNIIKSKIDADTEKFVETCNNRAYGIYENRMKEAGKSPLSRDEWEEHGKPNLSRDEWEAERDK